MTPTANPSSSTNEPIPGYKLVKRIGAGGYGEVWTAEAPGELAYALDYVAAHPDIVHVERAS